jgi:hypothetical protein
MSRPIGVRPTPSPPTITIASRLSLGAGVATAVGNTAAASGASPWSDAANALLAFPFVLEAPTTFYKGFWGNGASVGGNSEVALYDEAFALIATTGSVLGSGASLPQAAAFTGSATPRMPPGLYYGAMAHNATTTGQIWRWASGTVAAVWQSLGCWRQAAVTLGSLPATATPGDITNVAFPLFGFITRSVFDV